MVVGDRQRDESSPPARASSGATTLSRSLRYETPVPFIIRWAREQRPLGYETVDAGRHVVVNLGGENRDPPAYTHPMEINFGCKVTHHLAFGGGVHRYLGSHLTRQELRVAPQEWHRGIPEYVLSSGYEVTYQRPMRYMPDLQLSWQTINRTEVL